MSALQVRIRCGAVGIRHRPDWTYLLRRSNRPSRDRFMPLSPVGGIQAWQ